jgi:predicted porin
MNKKVMALAVAGVLAAPVAALAQVQIGGSITMFYYQHDPENPSTGQSGDILELSEPEIYIRGSEKLGGGLEAWFQCTSSMDGMVGGASAVTNSGWCARNSGIGLRGGFGNFFVGNWDQPQKLVFNAGRGWWGGTNAFTGGSAVLLNGGSASGTANPVTTTAGFLSATSVPGVTTTTSNNPGTFFRRQANSLNYHSPNWGGFSLQAGYSANNESTGIPESSSLTPRMYSLAGQFRTGPIYVGVGYEGHTDYNPANQASGAGPTAYNGGDDTNITAVVGFQMGGFSVRALYSKSEYETTNSTSLDVDGYGIFADWNISGPHTLRLQAAEVSDTSGSSTVSVGSYKGSAASSCAGGGASATSCASDTGAKLYGLAYSYALSKRTMVSVAYTAIDNDSKAAFSKGKTAATSGGKQTTTGLILQHRF